MRPAAEEAQDAPGMGAIGPFTDDLMAEADQSVGCKNNSIRVYARDSEPFAEGIPNGRFAQGEGGRRCFHHFWPNDVELEAGFGEKLRTARGTGSKDETRPSRRAHGFFGLADFSLGD